MDNSGIVQKIISAGCFEQRIDCSKTYVNWLPWQHIVQLFAWKKIFIGNYVERKSPSLSAHWLTM